MRRPGSAGRRYGAARTGGGGAAVLGAILLEVTGSLALKGALERPLLYVLVAVGYAGAFALLSVALRAGTGLTVAYGLWGAGGVALTATLSLLIFDEPLTPLMAAGIVVVIAGVLCVELGSRPPSSERTGAG